MSPPLLIVETSMHAFNQSLSYDQRMHAVDVKGSIAYAKSLTLVGILNKDEETKIVSGLLAVEQEWKDGSVRQSVFSRFFIQPLQFEIHPDDEDIHTANERRLSELIGPLGGKLHTGRSRNDQVATDMRLWLLDAIKDVEQGLTGLIRVMAERADQEKHILLPGYTHLQVWRKLYASIGLDRFMLRIFHSVVNLSGGLICYCHMVSRSDPISKGFESSFLEFLCRLSAAVPSQGILSLLIGSSSQQSLVSSPLLKIAYGASATGILSSNF
jgi:hypothetical protein